MKNRQKFIRTYDGLGPEAVLLAIMLEVIKNLGARHYGITMLVKNWGQVLSRLPPYSLYRNELGQGKAKRTVGLTLQQQLH
jgi:hypothetical protein